jgi:aquaporin Z
MHKALLVEFLGTLFLAFIIFATGNYLAIGAALALAVLLGGKYSGGAFNPAVAIALAMSGKISKQMVLPYILAESLGAIVAYYLYKHVSQ